MVKTIIIYFFIFIENLLFFKKKKKIRTFSICSHHFPLGFPSFLILVMPLTLGYISIITSDLITLTLKPWNLKLLKP
jgi:hypothetical protein